LYFCIPGNEKLSEYWDAVEDRLFKIRHCMNIDGVERRLPLFEPPIDPALLVKATAAGLDLSTVLSEVEAPLPLYRFTAMLQRALEMCAEVRTLGNALVSALEKKDAEELARLRSGHEVQLLKLVRQLKEQQKQEAEANLEALRKTREVVAERFANYQRLLGKNGAIPARDAVVSLEPSTSRLAQANSGDAAAQGLVLTQAEARHLEYMGDANDYSLTAGGFATAAAVFHTMPDVTASVSLFGFLGASSTTGGSHLGHATSAIGTGIDLAARHASFQSNRFQIIGVHERRHDEWRFQSNIAAKELEQIDKQILAQKIRKEIAARDIENHDEQIANAVEVDEFLRDKKYTNQELYAWMSGRLSATYFRTFQLAHRLSKEAERAYRFELGLSDSNFIEFGYWDTLKKGLMAGEGLHLDLKRMDAAYLEQNRREYEITKHVSLLALNPAALITLRQTGKCEFSVPEALYDLDYPGHFMRRVKSVSVTIPCVTGPYTGVNCTLTLLKSSVRRAANAAGGYARRDDGAEPDSRFKDDFSSIQSIATSSGQNDSGLFDANLSDERYLPFEGAGAISEWKIELPVSFRAFDYDTISDVILHLRFTARDGGSVLKGAARDQLTKALNDIVGARGKNGLSRLFSLRHEFASEWYRFVNPTASVNDPTMAVPLSKDRFPAIFRDPRVKLTLSSFQVLAALKLEYLADHPVETIKLSLRAEDAHSTSGMALTRAERFHEGEVPAAGEPRTWTLAGWLQEDPATGVDSRLDPHALEDILLVCRYEVAE
jgi:hypothetical protein